MGELRLRKRGTKWEYSFEGARIGGKRQYISKTGFRTKADAIAFGTKAMDEYNRAGIIFNPKDISFSDYLDLWVEQYCRVNCKQITIENYQKKIRLYIKPALGKYKLASLTPLVIQKFIDDMFNNGYSRNTLAVIKGILTGSLSYAVQPLCYIQNNPSLYVKLPSMRAESAVRTRTAPHVVVTSEQMKMVLNRFPEGTSSHIPLLIGYKCGLRLGEAFALTWDCIDFGNKTLTVDKQVQWRERNRNTGESGYWYLSSPKYNSVRTIEISSDLIEVLKREKEKQDKAVHLYKELYVKNYVDDKKILNTDGRGKRIHFVMVRIDGTYIISRNMQYVSNVARHELNLPKFDYHSLRHTHATMLAEMGASPKYVQQRLGHKNIQITMQIYQHLTQKISTEGAKLLETI